MSKSRQLAGALAKTGQACSRVFYGWCSKAATFSRRICRVSQWLSAVSRMPAGRVRPPGRVAPSVVAENLVLCYCYSHRAIYNACFCSYTETSVE